MKIAVLVSGGVDSSVALSLLKKQGHDLTAFYLKIWLEDELSFLGTCPWQEDLKYVKAVCRKLRVPLKVISLQKEYWKNVVSYTLREIKAGRTPNPDMMCNQVIKFGLFYKKINKEFDKVATGHYAQVKENKGIFYLSRSPDPVKDQTYFLADLSQKQLARALFPIGKYTKSEVRKLAYKFDLPNKDRKDSQGICFLGQIKFKEFVKHHLGEKRGDVVEYETGKKVGNHDGCWFFTIGQRRGLALGHGPWYVVKKNIRKNIVYVSNRFEKLEKERSLFFVGNFNWIIGKPKIKILHVKIRHGPKLYKCTIKFRKNQKIADVKIKGRDQGLAPGQFAVFYDGKVCLGGGVIQ